MEEKDWIKQQINDMDESVMFTIIECCKQLYIDGTPMYEWDCCCIKDVLDKVIDEIG